MEIFGGWTAFAAVGIAIGFVIGNGVLIDDDDVNCGLTELLFSAIGDCLEVAEAKLDDF